MKKTFKLTYILLLLIITLPCFVFNAEAETFNGISSETITANSNSPLVISVKYSDWATHVSSYSISQNGKTIKYDYGLSGVQGPNSTQAKVDISSLKSGTYTLTYTYNRFKYYYKNGQPYVSDYKTGISISCTLIVNHIHDFEWSNSADGNSCIGNCPCGTQTIQSHEWITKQVIIESSHLTQGSQIAFCSNCKVESTIAAPLLNHNGYFESYDDLQHAYICNDCNVTEYAPHSNLSANAACEDIVCTECNAIVKAALGHDLITCEAKSPTCTQTGWTEYQKCSRCTYSTASTKIPALGHNYKKEIIDPTCTQNGAINYTCLNCEDFYSEILYSSGHSYGSWHERVEPSCTTEGSVGYYPCVCGSYFDGAYNLLDNIVIPPLEHHIVEGVSNQINIVTQTNDKTYPFLFVDGWYVSTNKDHSTKSVFKIKANQNCTIEISIKISCEPGTYFGWTSDSITYYGDWFSVCKKSSNTSTSKILYEASGSSEKVLSITLTKGEYIELSYTKDDKISKNKDSVFFKILSDVQVETGNIRYISTDTLSPTCTQAVVCDACHEIVKPALGHTGNAIVENKIDATCTIDGSYDSVVYCSVCAVEASREAKTIDKLGHDHSTEWTVDVEPTCTTVGSKSHHCSRCEDKADITEVAALGHSFTNYKFNNDATYTENGTETAKCDRCDVTDTRTDEDSALGLDQKFKDEMAALSKDASTETTYAELYSVLQTYATLSDTEKASVATEYATLQQLIENYNTKAQVANTELAEATEIAFAPIVATGFAFLAALWFLLKKKFFI